MSRDRHHDTLALFVAGLGLVAVTLGAAALHARPEWRDYQNEFRDLVAQRFGEERASRLPGGVQQLWVARLQRADRCVTCHEGVEWKGLEKASHPYATHPKPELFEAHPLVDYGCTTCHGGQPYATTVAEAHGEVEHWEEPLLSTGLAATYTLTKPGALVQVRCNGCHRYERTTAGMDEINLAKSLVAERGCRACHIVNGRGGKVGPDLTWEADKSPEQFDYSRVSPPTAFAWHVAHLKNPKEVAPTSIMPSFNFDSRQAQALAMLVMSWRSLQVPASYLPGVRLADVPTPEEEEAERRMSTGPGAFFVSKGCYICHSISGWQIDSPTDIGPDLTNAFDDTQRRFGRSLDDFLTRPTGTMAVVLTTQIRLTDDERRNAIALLTRVFREVQSRQRGEPAPPSSKKERRPS